MKALHLTSEYLCYVEDGTHAQRFLSAEVALLRKIDVDVEGGWKVGEPCVPFLVCVLESTADYLGYLTPPLPKPLH